ncbi:CU044_5270 family protein [Promicromonospora sp. Marseille-Q5078]
MDEMTVLRQAGELLDPPTAEPSAALRRRVLDELEAELSAPVPTLQAVGSGGGDDHGPGPDHRPDRDRSGRRGVGRRVAIAAGIAAVTAGALAIVPTVGDRPAASAEAVEILQAAASQAAQEPAWDPRADQFVYTRAVEAVQDGTVVNGKIGELPEPSIRQSWISIDGQHPGVVTGANDPATDDTDPDHPVTEMWIDPCTEDCGNLAAFPASMPTDGDPDTMRDFLYDSPVNEYWQEPSVEPTPLRRERAAFVLAVQLLENGALPPQAESALLAAIAQIPGVTGAGEITDVAGRSGVGVGLTDSLGYRTDLIFDRDTDEFLGVRRLSPEGDVDMLWALLESGLVDAVGDTP